MPADPDTKVEPVDPAILEAASHGAGTHGEPSTVVADGELYGLLAEFDTPGELIEAAKKVRDAGYTEFDCFSPFPVHGIDPAMGIKRTILPLIVFAGGFTGLLGGILLQWWCNAYNWPWNIAGKPAWSIPANVPIAFELTILLSVFASFFGMWILNKLPQVWHPFFRLDRFGRVTDDAFLLGIEARDRRFDADKTQQLLQGAGAIAIDPCYLNPDPVEEGDAEVDRRLHHLEHGVRADPVRDRRQGAQLALERAALPHLPGHGFPAEVQG